MTASALPTTDYDVIIVGFGPTGMVLSALLGQQGHRVAVIERYSGLFNLPRAATFDDDAMRLLQKLTIAETVAAGTRTQLTYDWCSADGEVLIRHEFSDFGRSGWPEFNMMFQPALESELDALCRRLPGIDIFHGNTVTELRQGEDGVEVVAQSTDETGALAATAGAQTRTFTARYAIGCDGGNSQVQASLGVAVDDYGFQEPWLVCDFRIVSDVELPMAQQFGDPKQPTSIVSIGPNHHRFSFMLDQAIASADVDIDDVWRRVSRWITPADAELIRVAPYTFRSTVAEQWRHGNILLAGDAAHQMPPFLGQGMCSGFRDAHNLAWKIDSILKNESGDEILDSYMAERSPHVRAITARAVELGRVQTIRDEAAAERRDEEFLRKKLSGERPQSFRFPGYQDGVLATGATEDSARGELMPQGWVELNAPSWQRFDDIVGRGWVLLARDRSVIDALDHADLELWRARLGATVVLSERGAVGAVTEIRDVGRTYQQWFDEHACDAVIVRPDWYIFGSVPAGDAVAALVAQCLGLFDFSATNVHQLKN